MPLLHKQPFRRKRPLGVKDNEKLFFCDLTNEVFRDYEEFCQRIILCNSLIWSCELTGKSGLTYQEAQACESSARNSIKRFPTELRVPVLFLASITKRSSFLDLAEDVFIYTRDRYFIGEYVEIVLDNNDWCQGQIQKVIPPLETVVSRNRLMKPYDKDVAVHFRYEVEKIDAIYDDEISEIHVLESHRIRRKKSVYSREKCRLFIKHCLEQNRDGLWVVKEDIVREYGLRNTKFSDIFAGPQPIFDQSKKIRKLSESPPSKKQQALQNKPNNVIKNHKKQECIDRYIKGSKKHQQASPAKGSPKKLAQKNVINKMKKKYQNLNSQKNQASGKKLLNNKMNTVNQQKNKIHQSRLSKQKKLEEEMRLRELNREAEKRKKIEEKLRLKEKQKEEKIKLAAFMREWNRQREDLECEDLKELPRPAPLRCDIPDECFADFVMVLEFLHSFKVVLQCKNFFPQGTVSFEIVERALTANEVAGPLCDLFQLLLQSVFNMQEEEDEEMDTANLQESDDIDIRNRDDGTYASAIRAATVASSWSQLYYGQSLSKLTLDSLTLTEILRLHLLSSGGRSGELSSKWRYQQRGGYTSEDDPGLQFRLEYPNILQALSVKTIYELPIVDKLKVMTCLINQLLTYAMVRDIIDERAEQIKQIKADLKASQTAELKKEREVAALKNKEKKEAKQKLAAGNPTEGGPPSDVPQVPEVLTPEEAEKKAAKDEAQKLKMEKELARKKLEWQKKINEIQTIAMGFQILPLGRDRAYRRFWVFSSLPGLFVENDECIPAPCLPKPTPAADPALLRYDDTLSYVKKLFMDEQNGSSDKENDAGEFAREVPRGVNFSPSKKRLGEKNDCESAVLQTNTLANTQGSDKVNNVDDLILPRSFLCTANSSNCPVHSVNIVRTKWAYYSEEDDVTNLIRSLNRRGIRESELRQALMQDQERILKSVSSCPVHKLDKFKVVEDQPERKTRATGPRYDNTNLDYPPETPIEDVFELTLRDTILELENKIEMGGLGSLKVFNREIWIKALHNRSYDMQCNILKWGKNSFRKALNAVPNNVDEPPQEEERLHNGDVDDTESDISTEKEEVLQKPVLRDLACAILQVEQSVEKKYLIKPLGPDEDKKNKEEGKSKKWSALYRWESYLMESTSFSQLFLHVSTLENSIEWSRSALNAFCRLCRKRGDGENMLLCDECNKGHHIYCLKPKLSKIPLGNWYCQKCKPGFKVRPTKRSRKIFSADSDDEENEEQECNMCRGQGELVKCKTCSRKYHPDCVEPPLQKIPRMGTWSCHRCPSKSDDGKTKSDYSKSKLDDSKSKSDDTKSKTEHESRSQRRRSILNCDDPEPRQRRGCATVAVANISKFAKRLRSGSWDEESSVQSDDGQNDVDSPPTRRSYRKSQGIKHDLPLDNAVLQDLLTEVMHHDDAWPFLWPVQKSKVPDYHTIVKHPMDLGTIKNKLNMLVYTNNNEFIADALLIFDNCELYNNEDSEEYKAGERLCSFFKKRCKQVGLEISDETLEAEEKENPVKRPRLC